MILVTETLKIPTETGLSIRDITEAIRELVARHRVDRGLVQANMVGSTGSLTTIEFEPGVIEDLKQAIRRLAPPEDLYQHDKAWNDGNGHSHVQAALLGPSVAIAIRQGALALGTWQQIVAINHDNRPRTREISVTILGEPA